MSTLVLPVHHLFERKREETPQRTAVEHGDDSLTYRELNRRANRLAHRLRDLGVGPDQPVGLCIERSLDRIVTVLGILKAGGAYLPLDPAYPEKRLAYMLEQSGAEVVVTQDDLRSVVPLEGRQDICIDSEWPSIAEYPTTEPGVAVDDQGLAFVIYTSGSTGKPKGVAMPHGPLSRLVRWQVERSGVETGKTLQFAPISFDVSFQEIFSTFAAGGTLVLVSETKRRDPHAMLDLIERAGIDRLFVPYVALRQLAHTGVEADRYPRSLSEVITAGEQLRVTPELADWFDGLPDCSLENQYGPTETHVVTAHRLPEDPDEWPLLPAIGTALPHARIHLLSDNLKPVEQGESGEIFIGGDCLAREYLHRPELTDESFIRAPPGVDEEGRVYRTGDLARRRSDGTLEFLGRRDNQLKVRGHRVEPGEVEAALEEHTGVAKAVVVGHGDDPGETRLAAYLVADEGSSGPPTVGALREHVRDLVPDYMVPSYFVPVDEIPLTASGKTDRRALPDPRTDRPDLGADYVSPSTPTESKLVAIWEDELGIDPVGVEDNFFELGGDSLHAVAIFTRIRDRFGVDIPFEAIFNDPTVAQLAERVDEKAERDSDTPPIRRVSRDEDLPLSFAQERVWFLERLTPETPAYSVPYYFRLSGGLDVDALETSLNALIQRHEVLRTTLPEVEGEPRQRVHDELDWSLETRDLTHLPADEREAALRSELEAQVDRQFDLEAGPLVRAGVVRLDDAEYAFWLNLHHTITDGRSMEVLFDELSTIYAAVRADEPHGLPGPRLHYADYAIWKRRELTSGDRLDRLADWWREELEGAPPLHEFPTDHPRPTRQTYRGDRVFFEWGEELTDSLRDLGGRHNMTLPMVLLTGFAALVRRYTEEEGLVIGVPTLGRDRVEFERVPGFFVNTVPIHLEFAPDMTFEELLNQVQRVSLAALEHDELPFEQLVQELAIERDPSHNPLVQLAFAPQPPGARDLQLDGVSVSDPDIGRHTSVFDLTLYYREASGGLQGSFEYNTDLFERETIERVLRHMRTLLDGARRDPSTGVEELSMLDDRERKQLEEWNDTAVPVDADRTFYELFEAQVRESPDSVAVVAADGRTLTYDELDRRANRLAHYLRDLGVEPENRVALCLDRSPDLIVAILGVLKAGGAYLPIDPAYPEDRIALMIDDAEPAVVLTQSHQDKPGAVVEDLPLVEVDGDWSRIARRSDESPGRIAEPHHLAYVIYTSGSTGRPKGVMVERRSVVNLVETVRPAFGIEAGDRVLQYASPSFDVAVSDIGTTLTAGATLVLPPPGKKLLGVELGRFFRDQGIDVAPLPPAVLPDVPRHLADDVGTIAVAGEACPAEVVENWAPGRRFINAYGPTEATVYATYAEPEPTGEAPPIGRPFGNYTVYVLDPAGNRVPVGVPGELYIGGPGVARGYLNRPELTEESFVPDPFSPDPEARLFRTGDMVRWRPDGQLDFLGRRDSQVQLRGYRIELDEVAETIRQHDEVGNAAVVVDEDDDGNRRLLAYLETRDEAGVGPAGGAETAEPLPARLKRYVEGKLPDYMVPARLLVLEELPLNTSGKVDDGALPAPDEVDPTRDRDILEPRTDLERELVSIWSDLLGLERVGVEEDFFDLGGTSLLIARLAYRIEEEIGATVEMRALYETPTIAELAELVEGSDAERSVSELCFTPSLDLDEEARLDASITGDAPPAGAPENVLLTGATGFVGSHLLAELLDRTDARVYPLVRADDEDHARERLHGVFQEYDLDTGDLDDRVLPVVGDLAEDRLGLDRATFEALAATVDEVYHAGAKVDHVRGYFDVKSANVSGTHEVLRFATHTQLKPVQYISTLDVIHPAAYADEGTVPEGAPAGPVGKLPNGYMQSKCVAETMVSEAIDRDVPATIYRLGSVCGRSDTGVCDPNDFTHSSLRSVVDLGVADDLNPDMAMTPVDFTAEAIVSLSRWDRARGEILHVTNPEPAYWLDLVDQLNRRGYSVDTVSFASLVDRIRRAARAGSDTPILAFLPFVTQRLPGSDRYVVADHFAHVRWGCDTAMEGLREMGVDGPPAPEAILDRSLDHLVSEGVMEPPR